jgi:YHS domain-containing protein
MIRVVVTILLGIFLITIVRMFIGVVMKGVASMFQPEEPGKGTPRPPNVVGGELKRDPVCGTYVAAETAVIRTVGGKRVHFCSEACRDKYKA